MLRNRYQGMVCRTVRLLAGHKGIKRLRFGNIQDMKVQCS